MVEIIFRFSQIRLCLLYAGACLFVCGECIIALGFRDCRGIGLKYFHHSVIVTLGAFFLGSRSFQIGYALIHDCTISRIVETIQNRAFLNDIAFLEIDRLDKAFDLRNDFDLFNRLGMSDKFPRQVVRP